MTHGTEALHAGEPVPLPSGGTLRIVERTRTTVHGAGCWRGAFVQREPHALVLRGADGRVRVLAVGAEPVSTAASSEARPLDVHEPSGPAVAAARSPTARGLDDTSAERPPAARRVARADRGFIRESTVDDTMKRKILALLEGHRVMTIATLRPDGWPQATTVGYVHEGLTLWFLCGRESQKARNLALDNRVSITIDHDTPDILAIAGLSMAARAHRVTDPVEARKVIAMLPLRYPDAPPSTAALKMPAPEEVALFRVVPEIVSVLDYTQGFAHTDLVTC